MDNSETINIKSIRGTREWAVAEINCTQGCPHGCLYCYARYDLVVKKARITAAEWLECRVDQEAAEMSLKKYNGQVMFPARHDIVSENVEECLATLVNLLRGGNKVLVVSKPSIEIIQKLSSALKEYKKQLLFRFTITTRNNKHIEIWEPFASSYLERKQCLEFIFNEGFSTSVSVEPMLDTGDVVEMVRELMPYVSQSIWLGKMNKVGRRVLEDSETIRREILRINNEQKDEIIFSIYDQLKGYRKVRWKESIKEVVGLPTASQPGLDV